MKKVKKLWEIPGKTVPEPYHRNAQVIYTPQYDEGVGDFSFLSVTLYPIDGDTNWHTHPVDEMIYIVTGRGEAKVGDEKTVAEPGTIVYAKAGTYHQIQNFADQSMQMVCYFTPALPKELIDGFMKDSSTRVPEFKP
jgi:quercetin dioxygenase-like cupin family protein